MGGAVLPMDETEQERTNELMDGGIDGRMDQWLHGME